MKNLDRAGKAVHYALIQTANKIELPKEIDLKVRNVSMRIMQGLQQRRPISIDDIEFLEFIYIKYSSEAKGLCEMHYARQLRHGTTDKEVVREKRKIKRRRCLALNCNEMVKGYEFCNKHYSRFKELGTPYIPKCGLEYCDKKHFKNGLCKGHYFQWIEYLNDNVPSDQINYYLNK